MLIPLGHLEQTRPLYLAAVVLSWSAAALAINATASEGIPLLASLLLAAAMLALAVTSVRAQKDRWAQALVLRSGAKPNKVNPTLQFIGFLSILLSIWIGLDAWESLGKP